MFDCDVVIVGGGPAGLAAGIYLGRAKYRTIVLEKESFGGKIKDVERVENYPGFATGVSGAHLASEMVTQAAQYGLQLEQGEVVEIEPFTSCRSVKCANGTTIVTAVVIIAGGCRPKKLNISGEEALAGKGVFNCAFCDGNQFVDRTVVVCGGGDSGITEALYMTKLASKVILVEAMPEFSATAILKERALANPKLEIRTGMKVKAILGENKVEGAALMGEEGQVETMKVDGILVHVGLEPNTGYLKNVLPLDNSGRIQVNNDMETKVPYILAAGDIRSRSAGQIAAAVGDGAVAGISAIRLLRELG